MTCQVCGNDDASLHLCSDCLHGNYVPTLQRALNSELGGKPEDWLALATTLHQAITG